MLPHPLGGASQPFVALDFRSPIRVFANPAIVAEERPHLAGLGSYPGARRDDGFVASDNVEDFPGQVADAHPLARAQMIEAPGNPLNGGVRHGEETPNRVVDVGQIPNGIERPETNGVARIRQRLAENRGHHGPGRLTRSEGVKGPHDGNGQPEGEMIGFGQLVGGDLRGGVGGLSLQRVVLILGRIPRRSQGLGSRGVDQSRDLLLPTGFQHVHGPADVHVHIRLGGRVAVGNSYEGREMKDNAGSAHKVAYATSILNVAGNDLQPLLPHPGRSGGGGVPQDLLEMPPRPQGIVVDQGADAATALQQPLGQMAADKSPRTRYDDQGVVAHRQ